MLEGGAYAIETMTGAWGFEIEPGLRYYRFRISAKKDEDLF